MTSYVFFAPDCDVYFFEDAKEELFCSSCGTFVGESRYFPDHLPIKQLKSDFCFTYDGQLLFSKRAVDFLESEASSQLHFHKVNCKPEVFVLDTIEIVPFDSDKRKTRFVNPCVLCGNYESIVGSTPAFLQAESDVGTLSFVATDLKFGSEREKSPLYIVGESLAQKLRKVFKEIDLEKVVL